MTAGQQRLLISFAHPDDEAFGMGGAIARYADAGTEVTLICATNGEAGDIPAGFLHGQQTVSELRLGELACAAETLGIQQVYSFGYRDSGMMNTPDNDHPESLWQAPEEKLVGQIVEIIRQKRPQVVVTFDPYGGYGHPDHIAIYRATRKAFHAAGQVDQYPEQLANGLTPYQPQKLYYTMFPRILIRVSVTIARLLGRDPRRMGSNHDMDLVAVLDATLPSHARLDVRKYYDAWMTASACHASQQSPRTSLPLPLVLQRRIFGWQSFHRAWPEVNGSKSQENDLFAGCQLDERTTS